MVLNIILNIYAYYKILSNLVVWVGMANFNLIICNQLTKHLLMKNLFLVISLVLISFMGCDVSRQEVSINIIPQPDALTLKKGFFQLKNDATIKCGSSEELRSTASLFCEQVNPVFDININVSSDSKKGDIILMLDSLQFKNKEAYELCINKKQILIKAGGAKGVFYGLQSLRQLLFQSEKNTGICLIQTLKIVDQPRFSYRGMHLDVCRHFMTKEEVKKYIDYMSLYKLNSFHWHLTDDQGWRIEIKQYPKLTEIGAWRSETYIGHPTYNNGIHKYDGIKHGGFYTQDDIREIVKYANERFITIIPEIEMPGHSQAAIASYPEMGVGGEKRQVKTDWGPVPFIFMPSEKTFTFLENILDEVMELFPSEYIHIGGDEAYKDLWKTDKKVQKLIKDLGLKDENELQSWFIQRIEKYINDKGRNIIGWDEILEGGLAPNATVMSWRGEQGGIEAARMKHQVIMTPGSYYYFCNYQADPKTEPLSADGPYTTIDSVYFYNPLPEVLTLEEKSYIIGVQGCAWTEFMSDFKQVEYMIFPRMLAIAEIGWTSAENNNSEDFHRRVWEHVPIFESLGVNYSKTGMPENPADKKKGK